MTRFLAFVRSTLGTVILTALATTVVFFTWNYVSSSSKTDDRVAIAKDDGKGLLPPLPTTTKPSGLAPSATVGKDCGQKDCVIVPFKEYAVKSSHGIIGTFKNCVDVPNAGDAKVVRCKDESGWTARFVHDPAGRLREVKHDS